MYPMVPSFDQISISRNGLAATIPRKLTILNRQGKPLQRYVVPETPFLDQKLHGSNTRETKMDIVGGSSVSSMKSIPASADSRNSRKASVRLYPKIGPEKQSILHLQKQSIHTPCPILVTDSSTSKKRNIYSTGAFGNSYACKLMKRIPLVKNHCSDPLGASKCERQVHLAGYQGNHPHKIAPSVPSAVLNASHEAYSEIEGWETHTRKYRNNLLKIADMSGFRKHLLGDFIKDSRDRLKESKPSLIPPKYNINSVAQNFQNSRHAFSSLKTSAESACAFNGNVSNSLKGGSSKSIIARHSRNLDSIKQSSPPVFPFHGKERVRNGSSNFTSNDARGIMSLERGTVSHEVHGDREERASPKDDDMIELHNSSSSPSSLRLGREVSDLDPTPHLVVEGEDIYEVGQNTQSGSTEGMTRQGSHAAPQPKDKVLLSSCRMSLWETGRFPGIPVEAAHARPKRLSLRRWIPGRPPTDALEQPQLGERRRLRRRASACPSTPRSSLKGKDTALKNYTEDSSIGNISVSSFTACISQKGLQSPPQERVSRQHTPETSWEHDPSLNVSKDETPEPLPILDMAKDVSPDLTTAGLDDKKSARSERAFRNPLDRLPVKPFTRTGTLLTKGNKTGNKPSLAHESGEVKLMAYEKSQSTSQRVVPPIMVTISVQSLPSVHSSAAVTSSGILPSPHATIDFGSLLEKYNDQQCGFSSSLIDNLQDQGNFPSPYTQTDPRIKKENTHPNGVNTPEEGCCNGSPVRITHKLKLVAAVVENRNGRICEGGSVNITEQNLQANSKILESSVSEANSDLASLSQLYQISSSAQNAIFTDSIFSYNTILQRFQRLEHAKANDATPAILTLDPMSTSLSSENEAFPSKMTTPHKISLPSRFTAGKGILPVLSPRANLRGFILESYRRRHGKSLEFHVVRADPQSPDDSRRATGVYDDEKGNPNDVCERSVVLKAAGEGDPGEGWRAGHRRGTLASAEPAPMEAFHPLGLHLTGTPNARN